MTACLDRHSRPRTGSLLPVGSRRIQTSATGRSTARECRLESVSRWVRAQTLGLGKVFALTANLDGSFELEQDRLVDKDLARFCAQKLDLVLLQLDLFPWAVATNCSRATKRRKRQSDVFEWFEGVFAGRLGYVLDGERRASRGATGSI